jgi:hypothetical protein
MTAAILAAALALTPPMHLPGDAGVAGARADARTWIVGARPGPAAAAVAARHGARHAGPASTGGWIVERPRARRFAAALRARGLLVYAEPNVLRRPHQVSLEHDPLTGSWRDTVVPPGTTPPPAGPDSPLIALVDSPAQPSHPEFTGGQTSTLRPRDIRDLHGTATAAVAAAPRNGIGMEGVWPGARALNVPLAPAITCGESADRIADALEAGAAVINMSYGSDQACFLEYVAIQFAVANEVVPVAAAGNEFEDGNPLEFPASLPHVITVASVADDGSSSLFSNANEAVDLSAPGEGIVSAVPPQHDEDGTPDGWQPVTGTSFSAPMVAAAVAWIRAARPDLSYDQAAQVVRLSARDVDEPGWDADTGYGVLDVAAALAKAPPPVDKLEPNDDIEWVDGRAFGEPDRAVFRGRGTKRLRSLVDRLEDPVDVYRVKVRPGRARVSVNPSFGDVELAVFNRRADTVGRRRGRLTRRDREGDRTERYTIRNRTGRKRIYYVAIGVSPDSTGLDAGYRLKVAR